MTRKGAFDRHSTASGPDDSYRYSYSYEQTVGTFVESLSRLMIMYFNLTLQRHESWCVKLSIIPSMQSWRQRLRQLVSHNTLQFMVDEDAVYPIAQVCLIEWP